MFSIKLDTKDQYLEGYEPLILTVEDEQFSHNDLFELLNSNLFSRDRWRDAEQSPEDSDPANDRYSIALFYKTEKAAAKTAITAVEMLRTYSEHY